MQKRITFAVAAMLTMGSLIVAAPAQAAETPYTPIIPMKPGTPVMVHPLDCEGTTGSHGCGPGWFWRNGERGWACYPCNN
jgi:hypothetical protein